MTLPDLIAREVAQRKALLRLIQAEDWNTTSASRLELKVCREKLRAMRSEIRKLRKPQ